MPGLGVTPEEAYATLLDAASEAEEEYDGSIKIYSVEFECKTEFWNSDCANGDYKLTMVDQPSLIWMGISGYAAQEYIEKNFLTILKNNKVRDGKFKIRYAMLLDENETGGDDTLLPFMDYVVNNNKLFIGIDKE